MSLPGKQTAIVVEGPGKIAVHHDAPMPVMRPDMAIVKTHAVAINPADAKMPDYSAVPGSILGFDYAGVVVVLGSDAEKAGKLKIGDRVAGLVHGMNELIPECGAFAEYVGGCADILIKLPDSMSFEEGATFGTGVATAAMALFRDLGCEKLSSLRKGEPVKPGDEDAEFVLVAGGSSATGTRAIQLLKLAGLRPITTASTRNFDLCYKFGAEMVFDYNDPDCAAQIKEYTNNELQYALDCVTQADTTELCYAALGRAGGKYAAVEPYTKAIAAKRSLTVSASWLMALEVFGGEVPLDGEYHRDANPANRTFGAEAFEAVESLLQRGLIQTHPGKPLPKGWNGVIDGVNTIRTQALSGQKLVCSVA